MSSDGTHPIIVMINPSTPNAGATVAITVTFNQTATENVGVTIGASPAGFFSSIPAQVTLPSGQNQLQFSATVATNATGGASISATSNGQSASADVAVPDM